MSGKGAVRYGHRHPEALCLMQYASKDGKALEVIWNSRDGVTPFVVRTPDGVEMSHVNWAGDIYAPDHVPQPGDRIFVDITPDLAEQYGRETAARWWNDPDYPAARSGQWESEERMAADLAASYLTPGAPALIVVEPPPTPEPRALFCVVHGTLHRADWPWEAEECISERDHAIMDARDRHEPLEPLGAWERFLAYRRCHKRGSHDWLDDGSTVGGIWLICRDCRLGDEYLPGVHEPPGGEPVWQARLARAGITPVKMGGERLPGPLSDHLAPMTPAEREEARAVLREEREALGPGEAPRRLAVGAGWAPPGDARPDPAGSSMDSEQPEKTEGNVGGSDDKPDTQEVGSSDVADAGSVLGDPADGEQKDEEKAPDAEQGGQEGDTDSGAGEGEGSGDSPGE